MTTYVAFDPILNSYLSDPWVGKPVASWQQAKKKWKRFKSAICPVSGTGLANTIRYKQNQPLIEVHEYDDHGHFVGSHDALPTLFEINFTANNSPYGNVTSAQNDEAFSKFQEILKFFNETVDNSGSTC